MIEAYLGVMAGWCLILGIALLGKRRPGSKQGKSSSQEWGKHEDI